MDKDHEGNREEVDLDQRNYEWQLNAQTLIPIHQDPQCWGDSVHSTT